MAKKQQEPELQYYRLMVSQHIGFDYTKEQIEIEHPVTHVKTIRYPSKKYEAGDDVPSYDDLVQKFGVEKFQYLQPRRARRGAVQVEPVRTPGGEVVQGLPDTSDDALERRQEEPGVSREDLETLSVSELRQLAQEDEIDLKHARSKDDIIEKILEAKK